MSGEVGMDLRVVTSNERLSPGIKDGGHAARWRPVDMVEKSGRVGAGAYVARCGSPGGSSRADTHLSTFRTVAANWPNIRSVLLRTPRSHTSSSQITSAPALVWSHCASETAQKLFAAALNTYVVQNTDRLDGQTLHLDRPVAPRVKGNVKVLRQHPKRALDIFAHRLL